MQSWIGTALCTIHYPVENPGILYLQVILTDGFQQHGQVFLYRLALFQRVAHEGGQQ